MPVETLQPIRTAEPTRTAEPIRNSSRPTAGLTFAVAALTAVSTLTAVGCSSLWPGGSEKSDEDPNLAELLTVPKPPKLIRDAAVPYGLQPMVAQGVAAANGLVGTGGAPDPSPFRDQLIEDMKRENVANPNHFLESDTTALVRVRTIVPPGARRGDPLDLLVVATPESRATDLHGGWVMNTRLRQQQVIRNQIRQSDVKAVGIGPILTKATHGPRHNESLKLEGIVLSGGRVQVDRPLGLLLRPKYKHVKISDGLASAINRRFFFFDGTSRRGIATAKEDDFIELETHPRYEGNEHRMLEVIRSVSGRPESASSQARLAELAERLADPATASDAALQLEAIGENAIPTLLAGLETDNRELRFYAAESLAYLDRQEAITPLVEAARETAAFRHSALATLQGLDSPLVVDALRKLADAESLEARYGGFCAIRRRPDGRNRQIGETVGDAFRLYQVPSEARPAVVASLRDTAEIVLFGDPAPIEISEFLLGPAGLMIKPEPNRPGHVRISRFQPGAEDQRAVVPADLPDVIRGIVAVGGGYGDAIATLRTAKAEGCLRDELAFDPLPEPLRTYYRDDPEASASDEPDSEDDTEEIDPDDS